MAHHTLSARLLGTAALLVAGCGEGSQTMPALDSGDAATRDTSDGSPGRDSGGDALDTSVDRDAAGDVAVTADAAADGDAGPVGGGSVGCPAGGYLRLVDVSTAADLSVALADASPGDQIRVAAGVYLGPTALAASGTASRRIVLCGAPGAWPVFRGGRFALRGSFTTVTGIVFEGPNGENNNVFIDGPHDVAFTGNEVRNGSWHAGVAIEETYNLSVTRNFIHDNGLTDIDHGIYYRHQAGAGNVIANNVIVNNHGRGISMHDNGGLAISDTAVVHNTIVRNGSTGILVSVNAGTGNVVANNVLADNGWIYDYQQIRLRTGSSNTIANNVLWSPTPSHRGVENTAMGNAVTGNVETDPLFVAADDFRVRTGSPAIGLALPTHSVPEDYAGRARDGAPDTGAYEH